MKIVALTLYPSLYRKNVQWLLFLKNWTGNVQSKQPQILRDETSDFQTPVDKQYLLTTYITPTAFFFPHKKNDVLYL